MLWFDCIKADLNKQGIEIGRYKVRRLMRGEGVQVIGKKRFKPRTTDSKGMFASPNLFKEIATDRCGAGEAVVGDITYIYLQGGGFCYLAMWQDVITKTIIGWSLTKTLEAELVISALRKAITKGSKKSRAIVHSYCRSQYASNGFRNLSKQKGLI